MRLRSILEILKQTIWEMVVKTEFNFEEAKMDRKAKELYSKVLVDGIAPYYFAVIRESKYYGDLDELNDKYRASIEYQGGAYGVKDYNLNKAKTYAGLVRHFADFKSANAWLKSALSDNFHFQPKDII